MGGIVCEPETEAAGHERTDSHKAMPLLWFGRPGQRLAAGSGPCHLQAQRALRQSGETYHLQKVRWYPIQPGA